ncbi:hypothetical protein BST81_12920 [Leptolyngbya sp. 'hensonii']|uniref:CBS domain-containing protein n=1 Tax=Leptolyngbya sp. 'hensonii' TaxID=1922337 RepID=UPI00094F6DAC|nr:CBS domain-containing protein [Leptolyngbya sp. 'hensonii']OLP17950.1 hypothetical protein BST81_12920 [Leptolyngbya sp. 'hensonii']
MTSGIFTAIDFATAIVRDPLLIGTNATVADAIALMSVGGTTCSYSCAVDSADQLLLAKSQTSCVLVVEAGQLVGIFTERDVIRLCTSGRPPAEVQITTVMTHPVLTLQETDLTDLFVPLQIFQRYRIRHLPVVDGQGQVLGLLTHDGLRQLLRPVDLLHLRLASEVMTSQVVQTQPETPLIEITRLMAEHQVSSVVIVTEQIEPGEPPSVSPIGIITERDIVQFLALELDFNQVHASTVMSTPVCAVPPQTSLWLIRSLMQERRINRVVVTDARGHLLGIVTQTSLLSALNPQEMYQLVETLEQKVTQLEAENLALLQARNTELEQQIQERTVKLQTQAERERLLAAIATQILASLDLSDVLNTTVTAVRSYLQCDRVLVYQFESDWSGIAVAESVGDGWRPSLHDRIEDPCFQENAAPLYGTGQKITIDNIYKANYPDCYLQLLAQYQVKANLVVPILVSGNLWGLLIGHHCRDFYCWQQTDLTLLDGIAVHLAIAIQRAIAYEQSQVELAEKRQAEAALKQSEAINRAILEAIPDLLVRLSPDGRHLSISSGGTVKVLYPDESQQASTIFDVLPLDLANQRLDHVHRALETQTLQIYEQEIEIGGELRYEEIRVVPNGTEEALVIIRDVTDRQRAEMALRQSEAQSHAILEAIPDFMFRLGADGRHRGRVTSYRALDVVPPEVDVSGQHISELLPAEAAERQLHFLRQTLETGELQIYEQQLQVGDRVQYEELRVIKSADDEALFMVRDITQRKQAEIALQELNRELEARVEERTAALRASEVQLRNLSDRLELAIHAGQIGIWEWDIVRDQVFWDDRMYELYGVQRSDFGNAYLAWLQAIHPDDPAAAETISEQARRGLREYNLEFRVIHGDGSIRFIQAHALIQRDAGGNPLRMIGINYDITERKQAEIQIQQANERLTLANAELSRATRLKDEFLANMSHELRTPLNAILGMSEGLQEEIFGPLNQRQLRAISTIESSGRHLLELINDILEVSKIEAGKLELEIASVSVNLLCESSLVFIKQQALQKNIQLQINFQPNLGDIAVDERRMRQVLLNLLNNAVKFTPAGGQVTLEVRSLHTMERTGINTPETGQDDQEVLAPGFWILFSVIDTGIGIAPEDLGNLFQPFVQIDSSLSRQYAGTGLGLTLVKQIVELHGGWVTVKSKVKQGSCFTVYLPQQSSRLSLSDPPIAAPGLVETDPSDLDRAGDTSLGIPEAIAAAPVILLAEDNRANIETISGYLKARGYQLILAHDGQAAIDLATRHTPDLILMDIQMPNLDGLEAIYQIRTQHQLVTVPIIALTALAMPGDREKCLDAGANDYLTKPVKLKQLESLIRQLLKHRCSSSE